MLTIHLSDNKDGVIEGIIPREVKNEISYNCSYEIDGSFFSEKFQKGHWDGYKKLFSAATQRFPIGLLSIVKDTLIKYNIPYTVKDHRVEPEYTIRDYNIPGVTFRPYQKEIIEKALKVKRGIIQAATGSGKSKCIVGLTKALSDLKVNIYVHRNTLLRQLQEDFEKAGITVGIIGDGERLVSDINIISLQSVLRKTKISKDIAVFAKDNIQLIEQAQVTIWDECHHLVTELFYNIHRMALNSYFRFGFSATPWRDDNADIVIQAATGKKMIEISASYLIEKGYLVTPKIFFLKIPSYPGLVKKATPGKPKDTYRDVYNKAVINYDLRNILIAEAARELVIHNITWIIAVKETKHGDIIMSYLEQYLPEGTNFAFIKGEGTSGKQKMKALKELNSGKLQGIVATTVFGEGVDVPTLGALINAKAAKSSIDTLQLYGRVLRPHASKSKVIVVDIADMTTPYLRSHTRARAKIVKSERLFEVTECKTLFEFKCELEDN